MMMVDSFACYIPAAILVALWTSMHFRCTASADCYEGPPRIIPDDQLDSLRFSVVIDAGSSGSRIHVYSWNEVEDQVQLPEFRHVFCKRTMPGVSECQSNSEIKDHILKLVNDSAPHVPEKLRPLSQIYFMATAGMRMMLEDNANNATNYIDELLSDRKLNPFLYRSPEYARILSGEEEGIFAWISANYLGKAFTKHGIRSLNTRGILELGGASTQIAFVPKGNILANKFPVRIAGITYNLYVHSYLNYGQEQVDSWIRDRVMEQEETLAKDKSTVGNPCMLSGDSVVKLVNGVNITFKGEGDPDECLKLLDQMLYTPTEQWRCSPKPCAIGSIYQPTIHPTMDFYVVGAFIYPLRNLNILRPDGTFSLQKLTAAAKKFCNTSLSELKLQRNETDKLSRECLTGLYMPKLFQKAYRFSSNTRQLRAPVEPNNTVIEWPLGAVIYEYEHRHCDVRCQMICPSAAKSGSVSLLHTAPVKVNPVRLAFGLLIAVVVGYNCL